MIEEYYFGFIKIKGKVYQNDIQIDPNDNILAWQRKKSHLVGKNDIEEALNQNLEIIIIGTGAEGIVQIDTKLQQEIKNKGIKLFIEPTGKAVKIFNELKKQNKKIVGFFHLTC